MNENFELLKFYENLRQEIIAQTEAQEEGAMIENVFTEIMLDYLSDAGETENARVCTDIKEDKLGRKIHKINGYALSENYETLDLFITIYSGSEEIKKTSKSDIDKAASLSTRFLNNSLKGYYKEVEESAQIFDLAQTIYENRNNLIRTNIFILSDGIFSADPPKSKNKNDKINISFAPWDLERFHRLWTSKNKREAIILDFKNQFVVKFHAFLCPQKTLIINAI